MPTPTTRRALASLALASAALAGTSSAGAQEPAPVDVRAALLDENESYDLTLAWRFRSGDGAGAERPELDDSGWQTAEPVTTRRASASDVAGTVGWFRRHVRIEPELEGRPLAIRLEATGAARLYVDGRLELETSPGDAATPTPATPATPAAASGVVELRGGTDHLFAVRYEPAREARAAADPPWSGFRVSFEARDAAERRLADQGRRIAVEAVFLSLAGFLAVLHLALYAAYPRRRENLYYAASMVAFAGIVLCDLRLARSADLATRAWAERVLAPFVLATFFFVLLTYYAVRLGRLPRSWIGFAAAGGALALWGSIDLEGPVRAWGWYVYFGAMAAEITRVESRPGKLARAGVSVLLVGLSAFGAFILLQILINLRVAPTVAGHREVYVFGMLAFAVAMSLFLAGDFARTSTQLERRLAEVSTLSEQVLGQERAAHQRELERRLLAAEDARKGAELESARKLQLSMLPASVPRVAGLEAAAEMRTATEVGGDYYDFKAAADGGLLVAVGDATGHGVAAGTMVTAVKAVFSVLDDSTALPTILGECDRALRRLNAGPLHMCLLLARVTPSSVTVCSAAMPPALLRRAASGEVEELDAGGLPLAARLRGEWTERRAALAPGDTLLLHSDGLPELLDPGGVELGYGGVAAALRDDGGVPPEELVRRLTARADAWRGPVEAADDLTLVAVRVSPRSA